MDVVGPSNLVTLIESFPPYWKPFSLRPLVPAVFPDEGHGFQRPENRLAFSAAAEAFLARHLGGRAE